jgi:hypothetical protein
MTRTWTPVLTSTPTETATFSATWTPTPTKTQGPAWTWTPTVTETPVVIDVFFVSKNLFHGDQESVSITVGTSRYPGSFNLSVYNSAGEHIKTLENRNLTSALLESYGWDGTNKYGEKCASGVYILYLIEPFKRKIARVLLMR